VEPFVELTDLLLVMSVHPGFGGQSFMPEVLPKVESARKFIDSHALPVDIQIDGGITVPCSEMPERILVADDDPDILRKRS